MAEVHTLAQIDFTVSVGIWDHKGFPWNGYEVKIRPALCC